MEILRSPFFLLVTCFSLFACGIKYIDRLFFSRSGCFCAWFLFSTQIPDPSLDLGPLSIQQKELLARLSLQKFYYLGKGNHCFAFVSEDGEHVVKFHKYPSFLRPLSWLAHPFRYHVGERRKGIQEYNEKKLLSHQQSYKNSFLDLSEESGLLFAHINKTQHLKTTLTLVDRAFGEITVPLDQMTFLVQKKADFLYPTLDKLYAEGKLQEAKEIVGSLIDVIASCYKKGYEDQDPVLFKNYGLLSDRAIAIDVGAFIPVAERDGKGCISYVKKVTYSLLETLEKKYPLLVPLYRERIKLLEETL